MRVMAATSAGATGRILISVMGTDQSLGQNNETPRVWPGAFGLNRWLPASAAVAHEAQQEQEQVDEVEIERQGAHHRLPAGDSAVIHRAVHLLDPLRVPCGEPGEDQDA